MKRFFWSLGAALLLGVCMVAIMALRYEQRVAPNTFVGLVNVGNLSEVEARHKVRVYWESAKRRPFTLTCPDITKPIPAWTPGRFGMAVDDVATIDATPKLDFWGNVMLAVGQYSGPTTHLPIVYVVRKPETAVFAKEVDAALPKASPARVTYVKGAISRTHESSVLGLNASAVEARVQAAVERGDYAVDLPLMEAPKAIPDAALDQIVEVVSSCTTHFPVRQTSRNMNLKIASGKLNGVVIAPGQELSFNTTVGERTVRDGFREAPVYKNGKHDVGIGGGICQVSSTLYNACLLADLEIVERHNHSMPVAYLPIGRDATVSYGSLDLRVRNGGQTPIAISSDFKPGSLTFRVLGKKTPGLSVRIVTSGHKSWPVKVQKVLDKKMKAGQTKIVEKGAARHSIVTYRYIYMDGVLVKKELLNHSFYPGGTRVVASGEKPKTAPKASEPGSTGTADRPPRPPQG